MKYLKIHSGGMAKVQKNFYVSRGFREAFDEWCSLNGYDPTSAFEACVMAFSEMSLEERQGAFARLRHWEDGGYTSLLGGAVKLSGKASLKLAAKHVPGKGGKAIPLTHHKGAGDPVKPEGGRRRDRGHGD